MQESQLSVVVFDGAVGGGRRDGGTYVVWGPLRIKCVLQTIELCHYHVLTRGGSALIHSKLVSDYMLGIRGY